MLGLYHHWLTNNTRFIKIRQEEKYLEFLEQASSLKSLAQEGHPHFQYLLADIYFQLNDKEQALYWLNKARQSGYIPAMKRVSLDVIEGFSHSDNPTKQSYPPTPFKQKCEEVFDTLISSEN